MYVALLHVVDLEIFQCDRLRIGSTGTYNEDYWNGVHRFMDFSVKMLPTIYFLGSQSWTTETWRPWFNYFSILLKCGNQVGMQQFILVDSTLSETLPYMVLNLASWEFICQLFKTVIGCFFFFRDARSSIVYRIRHFFRLFIHLPQQKNLTLLIWYYYHLKIYDSRFILHAKRPDWRRTKAAFLLCPEL